MNDELILDRYRLIGRLAVGGTAEVWRAHDEQLDRPVAVKRLHPHLVPDEASRRRLVAEARAAGALAHPVIVAVYDVDPESDAPAIVMELVEGESLAARLARSGPMSPAEAASLTADLADALFHAHQRGVIHRDVKPGNVLLSFDGRVRLVDFGIARILAESAERLTLTGTVVGTLSAMAPEQLAGGPITPRTDLYGLGVVLHEALTARPPYPATSPLALAEAQRAGPPPLEGVDPQLAAIVGACLAHDPAHRPLHAAALAEALRGWASGEATTSVRMAPAPVPAVPAVAAPDAVPSVRGSWPLFGALVMLAIVAVALLFGFAQRRDAVAVDPSPASSNSAAASSAPSSEPAWLAKLVEEIADECGADVASTAATELAVLEKEEAKDYADQLAEGCEASEDDGENGNSGRGNGNGRGNGSGNGNSGRGNGG